MNADQIFQEDISLISKKLSKFSKKIMGKTIVVTGGSGFIGTYIVSTLLNLNKDILKNPCRIIVIDNHITSSKIKNILEMKVKYLKYIEHDVTKPLNISGKVDYIIHAAGIASPVYYKKYPLETIDVAVIGTRNMLELARKKKVKSIIFFSSSEIYGDPPDDKIPTKESFNGNVSSIGPRSCYDESKRLGETLCTVYNTLYNVPVKVVRPFNVFGPGMHPNDYRVIPRFIYNAMHKSPIPVHGDGRQTRTFCYISDAVTGFFLVLFSGKNGEVYNVGSNQKEISMNKLAKIFNKLFGESLIIKNILYPKDYPQGEPLRRCPNVSKIKKELGYQPRIGLENGLIRTSSWCREKWMENGKLSS